MFKKRLPLIVLFTVVILVGLGLLINRNRTRPDYGPAAQRADSEYAKWKSSGLPTTKAELDPPIPDAENAAPQLRLAFQLFDPHRSATEWGAFYSPKRYENGELEKFIQKLDPLFDRLHAAAEKPHCNFPRDWDLGLTAYFPESGDFDSLARLLAADAEFKARKGDFKGALRNAHTCRKLGQFLADQPGFQNQFEAADIDRIALNAICLTAGRAAGNHQVLDDSRRLLEESEWEIDIDRMIRGEAYQTLAMLRNVTDEQIESAFRIPWDPVAFFDENPRPWTPRWPEPPREDHPKLVRDGIPESILTRAAFGEGLAFWNRHYSKLGAPNADLRKLAAEMDADLAALATSSSEPKKVVWLVFSPYGESSSSFSFAAAITGVEIHTSFRRTALAYVGVLQHQAETGTWPTTLADAGINVRDARDRKPIRYRVDGDSFRVWSMGWDDKDDNGRMPEEAAALGKSRDDSDHVYHYPWPKRIIKR